MWVPTPQYMEVLWDTYVDVCAGVDVGACVDVSNLLFSVGKKAKAFNETNKR